MAFTLWWQLATIISWCCAHHVPSYHDTNHSKQCWFQVVEANASTPTCVQGIFFLIEELWNLVGICSPKLPVVFLATWINSSFTDQKRIATQGPKNGGLHVAGIYFCVLTTVVEALADTIMDVLDMQYRIASPGGTEE